MKVYVDGENFRHGLSSILKKEGVLKEPKDLVSFPVRKLLADITASSDLDIKYFASKIKLPMGYVPEPETLEKVEEIKGLARVWAAQLANQDVEYIKAGYLKVKSGKPCPKCKQVTEVLQEKGVDVKMAVDLVKEAYENKAAKLFIFSSDSDLIPAMMSAKDQGAKIIYICFADRVNKAMSGSADETISISSGKIKQYYIEQN